MATTRERVQDRVMEEYDVLIGERPEKPADVTLAEVGQPQLLEMVTRLRGVLGITDDGSLPEGTLDDLVDYLHERWDGVTSDEMDEG